jgi:hypothetical protein
VKDKRVLLPRCRLAGPKSEIVAGGWIDTTATASSPTPQELVAWPDHALLAVAPTVVLPDDGKDDPMPSIVTRAAGSDACQFNVTDSPEQALVFDVLIVSVGTRQTGVTGPGAIALRREGRTGGGTGAKSGAKLMYVTG